MAEDCIFCRIVRGDVPSTRVYEDDHAVAFRDINPRALVHVLVVPREHVRSVAEAPADDPAWLGRLFLAANQVAEWEGIRQSGYRLVVNTGPDAGMEVPHLHIHVIGGEPTGWFARGASLRR